ncbi:hypothetical protein ACFVT1_39490 [Streptomyces sp. NPDC057963]|uniref:hypothetical protein n=1 Tax=Streptomyces sp. NPDC057963 TaxID=3346290 RepID=UPI0036F0AD3F
MAGALEHHRKARQITGLAVLVDVVDTALQFGPEADQGVVDVGDVAAVRDRRQGARPPLGDSLGVEDQGAARRWWPFTSEELRFPVIDQTTQASGT